MHFQSMCDDQSTSQELWVTLSKQQEVAIPELEDQQMEALGPASDEAAPVSAEHVAGSLGQIPESLECMGFVLPEDGNDESHSSPTL